MSYLDRLRPCKYTSPSGKTFTLFVDQVERSAAKKAAVHDLAGIDGAIVQDLGRGAKKYPLSCYIVGPDYDRTADAFAAALDERYTRKAPGKLQHPRWGDLDVCPLSYLQAEDLVGETRLGRFQVDFINAPEPSLLASTTSSAAIQSAADVAASLNLADLATSAAVDVVRLRGKITNAARAWTKGLRTIKGASDTIKSEIATLGLTIERTVDDLVAAPVSLCQALTALVRLPARVASRAEAKVETYRLLIEGTLAGLSGSTESDAALSTVSLSALAIASMEAATEGPLGSRDDALRVSRSLASAHSAIIAAIEDLEAASGYVAPPDLLAALALMSANVQTYLLDSLFSLRVERRIVLAGDRAPLELIRELYGEVDDLDAALDSFIEENHLTGDAILVIPRGSEIRYYA